jgi:hypothetical protein
MENIILENIIKELTNNFDSNHEQAEFNLYAIEDYIATFIIKKEIDNLKIINNYLSQMNVAEVITGTTAYLNGKISTMINITNTILRHYEINDIFGKLNNQEKEAIELLNISCEIELLELLKLFTEDTLISLLKKEIIFRVYNSYRLAPLGTLFTRMKNDLNLI